MADTHRNGDLPLGNLLQKHSAGACRLLMEQCPQQGLFHITSSCLDSLDTMLVRWFPQRAAVGKLLVHHSRAITMEEKAHDHASDSQCTGEHDRGCLVCSL